MAPIQPSPRTWILRFKHHRTTIMLHVDPLQRLSSVKAELLAALKDTHPDGRLNGLEIPQNADDIRLARPTDVNDLSAGWEPLERPPDEFDALDEEVRGKGKAKAGAGKGKTPLANSPQAVGVRDGDIVAFKFKDAGADEKTEPAEEDDGDGDAMIVIEEPPETWDVVVPTVEETYGEEDAAAAAPLKREVEMEGLQ